MCLQEAHCFYMNTYQLNSKYHSMKYQVLLLALFLPAWILYYPDNKYYLNQINKSLQHHRYLSTCCNTLRIYKIAVFAGDYTVTHCPFHCIHRIAGYLSIITKFIQITFGVISNIFILRILV